MGRSAKLFVSWGSAAALILALFPSALLPQDNGTGSLRGFIFERDSSVPVPGAVVLVKNVTSGAVLEAPPSDQLGAFKVQALMAGLYALGVRSEKGSFNSLDFFGITAGKTAKISIALDRYDPADAEAAEVVIKEQRIRGEAFIGKVARYVPETKEAEIDVEIGVIQAEDRIHIKGRVTDFYQDLRGLKSFGAKTKRVHSGHTAVLRSSKPCQQGDFVYIVCKRGVPPLFLAPLGLAAIVAGAVPLAAIYEEETVSQFKIK